MSTNAKFNCINLSVFADKVIALLLEIITSSPQASSATQDYLDAHVKEYHELLNYGQVTLDYLEDVRARGETGLKREVLESVYRELID